MFVQQIKLGLIALCFGLVSGGVVVLAQSGPNSIITEPGIPRPASFVNYVYPHNLSEVPTARWIWDGTGDTPTCYMNITVEQYFTVKCLNEPMLVYIAADNSYRATILNVTGNGNNWARSEIYNISTTGIACSKVINYKESQIKLTMYAQNLVVPNSLNCFQNPAALIYAVTTNDCPCDLDYFYNSDSCLCQYCQQYLTGCINCNSTTSCLTCNITSNWELHSTICRCLVPFIYMVGCLDCVMPGNPCSNCDNILRFKLNQGTGKCECQTRYGLAQDNQCKLCSESIPNCQTCSTTSTCTQCISDYALTGPIQCTYICPHAPTIGCLDCIIPGNPCSNCDTAIFFELNTDGGNCVCQRGYGLAQDNQCKLCSESIPNCQTCSTTSTCTQCISDYALTGPIQCTYICPHAPTIGCLDCIIPGNPCSNCDTAIFFELNTDGGNCVCQRGYGLAQDNQCKLCSESIPNCQTCSTTSTCTQCISDYALTGPIQCTYICPHAPTIGCLDCIIPGNPCSNCDTAIFFELNTDGGNCVCQRGYGLAQDNQCKLCSESIPNCQTCSTTSTCTQCISDYALTGPIQCTYICPHAPTIGCLDCIIPGNPCSNCDTAIFFELNTDGGNCVCQRGYGLAQDNQCKLCSESIPNCQTCSTTSTCTQCISDYALTGPIQCTYICPHAPTIGCLDCIIPGNPCSNCDTAIFFELNTDGGNCVCQRGYGLAQDNQCKLCSESIPNCQTCSTTSTCTQCISDYALTGPIQCTYICPHAPTIGCLDCIIPGNPCSNCDTAIFFELNTDGGNCVCQRGYGLAQDNQCKLCSESIPNCQTCSTTSTCTQCISDYALTGPIQCTYICPHAPTIGCLDCIIPGNPCSNCDTAIFFELNTDGGNCVCQRGYGLAQDNQCKLCSESIPNCQTCSTTSTCTQCISDYALTGPIQCTYICPHAPTIGCLDCIIPGNPCSNCDTAIFFELNTDGGNCVCQRGYGLAQDNQCKLCSESIPNCQTCSTTSTCTQCISDYALTGPIQCTYICPHAPTIGCLDCIIPGNPCSNCDTAIFFELNTDGGNCVCQRGYGLAQDNQCKLCSESIPNCQTCSTTSTCTQCISDYALTGPIQCTYICPHAPTIGCLDCIIPGNPCSNCDTAIFFELNTDGGNCVCQRGYGLAQDNQCKLCSESIPNCQTCSTTSTCTQCISDYALTGPIQCTYICPHAPTIGCLDCIIPGNPCSNCDTAIFFELNTDGGNCVCQRGYGLAQDNQCKLCSESIPNCQTCSTTSTCTQCISDYALTGPIQCTYICPHAPTIGCLDCIIPGNPCSNCDTAIFFELNTDGGNCVCQRGYGLAQDNQCKLCSESIPNCQTCSTTSTCTQCISDYALTGPIQCTYICPHAPTIGCLDCIIPGNPCSNCDTAIFFELNTDGGNCVCQRGYGLAQDNQCKLCSESIPNCQTCSTTSTCTQCISDYALTGPIQCTYICPHAPTIGCLDCIIPGNPCSNCDTAIFFELNTDGGNCVCQRGYGLAQDNQCKLCSESIPNCQTCSTTSTCINCSLGYFMTFSQCLQKCGDGFLKGIEQCDDSNYISGDGCSPTCYIQPDFMCTFHQSSHCCYTSPLQIKTFTVIKSPITNFITFTFKLGNNWLYFKEVNFSQIISSNGSLNNPIFTLSDTGILILSFQFEQILEGRTVEFTLQPSILNKTEFKCTPNSTFITSSLSSPNNIPIIPFSNTTYDTQDNFDTAYKTGLSLSYATLFFGLLTNKVIGLDLLGAWQVAFFSLSNINKVPPLLSPLMNLTAINGFNYAFDFGKGVVPERIAAINYSAAFLANCNYMVSLIFIDILIGLLLRSIAKLLPSHCRKLRNYGRRIMKEFFIMLVSFNSINIGFSAGLEFVYNRSAVGIFCSVICLLLPIAAIGILFTQAKANLGEFIALFKNKDCTQERYSAVVILFRVTIGLMMSLCNETELGSIIIFFIGMVFTFYQWGRMPFKKAYHNYRSVLAQLSVMAGLLIGMYYGSMKSTTAAEVRTTIDLPAYLLIVLLFLCIGISLAALIYQMHEQYALICKKKKEKENKSFISSMTEVQPIKPHLHLAEISKDLNLNSINIIGSKLDI